MKIGPIEIPPAGERRTGTFTFASDQGLAKYEWPYIAIAGLRYAAHSLGFEECDPAQKAAALAAAAGHARTLTEDA